MSSSPRLDDASIRYALALRPAYRVIRGERLKREWGDRADAALARLVADGLIRTVETTVITREGDEVTETVSFDYENTTEGNARLRELREVERKRKAKSTGIKAGRAIAKLDFLEREVLLLVVEHDRSGKGVLQQGTVAERLGAPGAEVSRAIRALREYGLVSRSKESTYWGWNNGQTTYTVTPAGRRIIERLEREGDLREALTTRATAS